MLYDEGLGREAQGPIGQFVLPTGGGIGTILDVAFSVRFPHSRAWIRFKAGSRYAKIHVGT